MKPRSLIPPALLLIFAAQCFYFAWDTGQTVDEPFYNATGYPIVRYNNYGFLGEHPPLIMQLASLPLLFIQPKYPIDQPIHLPDGTGYDLSKMGLQFLYGMGNDAHLVLFLERSVVIVIALFLGWVLYRWGQQLYGYGGAVLTLALYSFCPNMIAHASQFTTDLGVAAFFFFALYRLKRFFELPSLRNGIFTGLFCGLALMTKMSALLLFPTVLLLFVWFLMAERRQGEVSQSPNPAFDDWLGGLSLLLFFLSLGQKLVFLAIGPLCMAGVMLTRFGGVNRFSSIARRALCVFGYVLSAFFLVAIASKRPSVVVLASAIWVALMAILTVYIVIRRNMDPKISYMAKIFILIWLLACFVIALGHTDFYQAFISWNPFRHFVRTFNIASSHLVSGHTGCVAGSFITCDWKYFGSSLLIKTPVVTIILFLLGLGFLARLQVSKTNKVLLVLPPLLFLLVASFVNRIYIGVRHILPAYPFFFLIAGALIPGMSSLIASRTAGRIFGTILILLIGFSASRTVLIAPHYLSYFNEWIGSAEAGVKHLPVNAGQDHKRLVQLVKEKDIPLIRIASISGNPREYDYYGLRWEYVKESDFANPRPGYYALDLETYRDQQLDPESWFRNLSPKYKAGQTIYVFEKP